MSQLLKISGDGAWLSVEVLGYENRLAECESDANWLSSIVELSIGPFEGKLSAALSTHDFADFMEQLQKVNALAVPTAVFACDEDSLRIAVETSSLGSVRVSGHVKQISSFNASLSFSFDSDLTYIAQAVEQLRAVTEAYPVVSPSSVHGSSG
jgi:hypothetical protein